MKSADFRFYKDVNLIKNFKKNRGIKYSLKLLIGKFHVFYAVIVVPFVLIQGGNFYREKADIGPMCSRQFLDLTLLTTAFYFFSQLRGGGGGGGRDYIPHLRKQSYDYWIDLKFCTGNYWHRTSKIAKVCLFTWERLMAFRYLPPRIGFNDGKIAFLL